MAQYTVRQYSFQEPNKISEYEYLQLKQKLQNDPNFSFIDPNETITKAYSSLFKYLTGALISLPIFIVLMLVEADNGFLVLIALITMLWSVSGLILFLMSATELSSYAGFLKTKRAYYEEMEIQIRKSKNYDNFF